MRRAGPRAPLPSRDGMNSDRAQAYGRLMRTVRADGPEALEPTEQRWSARRPTPCCSARTCPGTTRLATGSRAWATSPAIWSVRAAGARPRRAAPARHRVLRADGPRSLRRARGRQLGDIELHYVERGSGRPLLLVPGIPAIASDWDAAGGAAERVAQGDRLRQPRQRRVHDVTAAPYTAAGLAADAVGLLDALEIERADVFGMSLGGMIAQELALGWPERVDRLVLGCTHCGLASTPSRPSREAGRAFALETDDWAERMRPSRRSRSPPGVGRASCSPASSRRSRRRAAARGLPRPDRRGARARQLRPPAGDRPARR